MGHVGRGNIYFTWPFIKVALVLNYFGQGAWMLANSDNPQYTAMESTQPVLPDDVSNVRYLAVILSVSAGVIASQALITGAFTMVSRKSRLNWMHLICRCGTRPARVASCTFRWSTACCASPHWPYSRHLSRIRNTSLPHMDWR